MKKFEIKAHDGPGRLGIVEKITTPNTIDSSIFKIAPDEGSAYNIEKELAVWSVKRTIAKSKKSVNNSDIGVIQGSKYIDLRVKCGKELEKIGFNGFLIANGDDLLLNPRDLVQTIVNLRKNLNPNSYLIFPFTEPSFIPVLSYMGIDGFLNESSKYYSYLNVLMTPTKNYDLYKYNIYENMTREDISIYNKVTIDLVLRETREHIKNGTLRNLVEERSSTSPQNSSVLKILDKDFKEYLMEHSQLY